MTLARLCFLIIWTPLNKVCGAGGQIKGLFKVNISSILMPYQKNEIAFTVSDMSRDFLAFA